LRAFPASGYYCGMKFGHHQRLVRIGAGALTLLLLHGLGLSGTVCAGCDHLVCAQSDSLGNLAGLDDLIVAGSAAVPLVAHFPGEQPAPGRPGPCSGMRCSNSTPVPVSTASPGPVGSDQLGTLSARAPFEVMAAHTLAIDDSVRNSRRRVSAIFHPPPIFVRKV
jgi:hypothetical protein